MEAEEPFDRPPPLRLAAALLDRLAHQLGDDGTRFIPAKALSKVLLTCSGTLKFTVATAALRC